MDVSAPLETSGATVLVRSSLQLVTDVPEGFEVCIESTTKALYLVTPVDELVEALNAPSSVGDEEDDDSVSVYSGVTSSSAASQAAPLSGTTRAITEALLSHKPDDPHVHTALPSPREVTDQQPREQQSLEPVDGTKDPLEVVDPADSKDPQSSHSQPSPADTADSKDTQDAAPLSEPSAKPALIAMGATIQGAWDLLCVEY